MGKTAAVASGQTLVGPDLQGALSDIVEEAIAEIRNVSPATIHRASSFKWSARAIASYRICIGSPLQEDRLRYLYLGEHYREAALAHAAMGEQWEPLYAEINKTMTDDRRAAFDVMRKAAPPVPARPRAKRIAKAAST